MQNIKTLHHIDKQHINVCKKEVIIGVLLADFILEHHKPNCTPMLWRTHTHKWHSGYVLAACNAKPKPRSVCRYGVFVFGGIQHVCATPGPIQAHAREPVTNFHLAHSAIGAQSSQACPHTSVRMSALIQ